MTIEISQAKDKLKKILSTLSSNDMGKVVSCLVKSSENSIELDYTLLVQNYDNVIIFNKPSENFFLTGLDQAFEFDSNEKNHFCDFSDQLNDLYKSNINNFGEYNLSSLPLILAASKFDTGRKSDDWKNFKHITLFVPKVLIFQQDKIVYLIYNFVFSGEDNLNDAEKFLIQLSSHLSKLSTWQNAAREIHYFKNENVINAELNGWNTSFNNAKSSLKENKIQKLVLSRPVSFELNKLPEWNSVISKLMTRYHDCYFFLYKIYDDVFFGASPEKFLSCKDEFVEVEAVAGSAPRGKKVSDDLKIESMLLENSKIRKEHLIVSNFVKDCLNEFSGQIYFNESPEIRKLDNIQHLVTKFIAGVRFENLLNLIDKLFPTPSVSGFQKEDAILILRNIEKHDRGLYSGILGWFDLNGNCEFTVTIRSALAEGKKITAFAGAGIVEESDSSDEFHETELKLKPILSLFNDDAKS